MQFYREIGDKDEVIADHKDYRVMRNLLWVLLPLLLITPPAVQADATAPCNSGSGNNSTECGVNSDTASADLSTAVGDAAEAKTNSSTAVGYRTSAFGDGSTAVGMDATAAASATGVGSTSRANAEQSTVLGSIANAYSTGATMLGFAAGINGLVPNSDSPASVAIGNFANIKPASPGAIAIGGTLAPIGPSTRGAEATGENAIAIGFEAQATQPGAIALGANVVANKAHTLTTGVPIEVRGDQGTAQVLVNEKSTGNTVRTLFSVVCNTCTPGFKFRQVLPSNNTWNFRMLQSGAFSVDDPATASKEAEFQSGGDLKIGGTLIQASSRGLKTDIEELRGQDVLAKLDQLPISEWSYKKDQGKVKHIGPMAEDFHALFKVGVDNKSLSSIDTAGVALAAIKALKQENELTRLVLAEKDTQITQLQDQIDDLKKMLSGMVVMNETAQIAGDLEN